MFVKCSVVHPQIVYTIPTVLWLSGTDWFCPYPPVAPITNMD